MNLNPSDIAIDRLHVRAPARDKASAVSEVEHAAWPQADRDEWLFIREVRIKAPRLWLGIRAAEAARNLANTAVRGGTRGSERAEAVRFRDLPELLAWLSADLAARRAASRWYWQRWRHLFGYPPAQALALLWEEHVEYLSATTAQLSSIRQLQDVWTALGTTRAERLRLVLAHRLGMALPPPVQADEPIPSRLASRVPGHLVARWTHALRPYPPTDPRRWLAAVLVALEWRPVLLRNEPGPLVAAISHALTPAVTGFPESRLPSPQPSDVEAMPRFAPSPATDTAADASVSSPAGEGEQPKLGRRGGVAAAGTTNGGRRDPLDASAAIRGAAGHETGRVGARIEPVSAAEFVRDDASPPGSGSGSGQGFQPGPDTASRDLGCETQRSPVTGPAPQPTTEPTEPDTAEVPVFAAVGELFSEQAGLFLLVNVINRPEIQSAIEESGGWEILPDGWAWLYRLGSELGLDPAGELASFLGERIGLSRVADLAALPRLPARDLLLARVEQIYGRQGIWNSALIQTPAWIRYSPSHLDIDFPMSSVRLDVRLAGLDINPGWVPWLGRVVTFYYREAAGARGGGAR